MTNVAFADLLPGDLVYFPTRNQRRGYIVVSNNVDSFILYYAHIDEPFHIKEHWYMGTKSYCEGELFRP